MSRINVANFRHPDATADSITVTSDGDTQINRALGLGGATYGTSGQVLTSAGSGAVPTWTTPAAGLFESVAAVTDRKAAGTSAGSSVSGTWSTRVLNHELFDPDGIVSLSSNQFTLGAGTYYVEWAVPIHDPSYAKTRLYNATDSVTVLDGEGLYSAPSLDLTVWFRGLARFTIASSKAFEIQYRAYSSEASYGLGISTNTGDYEYYTTVRIFKEA
jgi:hypothetical protein